MKFSKIIAGTMTWGKWGKDLSTAQMSELIKYCFDNGITTFDHADIYGGYTTEAAFGQAFKKSGVNRDSVEFISKCGIQYMAETRNNKVKHYDLSEKYIISSVEQSLKHLHTDHLDLLLLHRPSPLMHPDEIAAASQKLKEQGKIKALGVSNFTPSQTDLVRSKTEVAANQIQFSATHFESMLNGDLDHMMLHKIQPMAWSPLGVLFKEDTPQTTRLKTLMFDLIEKYTATADQLLLAWIMKHPAGIIPVIGTTNTERIANSIKATEIDLDLEDWFEIQVASQGHKVP
ncbi:aldo/keto reductase [Robertkochia marina]|uniref:Aldo/keto reductase n=1 Tax=Robertkochia marina TaxID=1227945 RepID=A0A4S3M3L1_9FLAO|nr:aldo/keto reductase [Robertkochia marina]THD69470.1 aldo/keto reductase [Robertkochia marina]TRZ47270.1 aldo/keto reductase [Robertkochia marina]